MRYLLDTDHISILQRRSGPEFGILWSRISREPCADALSRGYIDRLDKESRQHDDTFTRRIGILHRGGRP